MDLFPIKKSYPKPPKPLDIYLLVAYWSIGGWWKIINSFNKLEEAETMAERLPNGYGERRIFHLCESFT